MNSKRIRPTRVLALAAIIVGCLLLPATAGATPTSLKWNHFTLLENPNDGGGLDSVACAPAILASKSLLCVAGDVRGNVFATLHPAQGRSRWHRQYIDRRTAITGVACPSTQLCVAVDATGQVMHSTNPYGGAKYWSKPARIDTATQAGGGYAGFAAIACPSTQLCLAVDNAANGQVAFTTDPTGPASAWTLTTIGSNVMLDSVACASTTFCTIGGTNAYYATDPTGGASAWKAVASLSSGYSAIASLSCQTLKLCVGVGYGNAGTGLAAGSSSPSTTSWTDSLIGSDPPAPETGVLDSVACPQRNFCVAADSSSHVYTSSTPVRGNWSVAKPLKHNSQSTVSQIACNVKLCVEVDNRGTAIYGAIKPGTRTTSSSTTTTTKPGTATTKSGTTTTKTGTTTTGAGTTTT